MNFFVKWCAWNHDLRSTASGTSSTNVLLLATFSGTLLSKNNIHRAVYIIQQKMKHCCNPYKNKTVIMRLVTRRKTPSLDNADRVKYIVRSLLPHVEPFQRQDRSSCVVRREDLFTLFTLFFQRRDDMWRPSRVTGGSTRLERYVWRFPAHGPTCWNEYHRLRGWRTCRVRRWRRQNPGAEVCGGQSVGWIGDAWKWPRKDRGFAGHGQEILQMPEDHSRGT